ncbi:MAG: hypothetical protein WBD40_11795, partial [Tepidisphaeraceae bacterium]
MTVSIAENAKIAKKSKQFHCLLGGLCGLGGLGVNPLKGETRPQAFHPSPVRRGCVRTQDD